MRSRDDGELLSVDCQTLFVMTRSGRIERENDPDHSTGPRLWFAGCQSGNLARVRLDVKDDAAAEIAALVATEPSFVMRDGAPENLDRYVELLSRDVPVTGHNMGVIFELPNHIEYEHDVKLVTSDGANGERLLASFAADGMPAGLEDLGFRDVSAFWKPWCAAMRNGEVASIAFAARLSESGAELGVATVRAMRGRGYAAAATAGWANMRSLRARALFYSTDRTNVSSQRVVERLRLRFIGSSLRLY